MAFEETLVLVKPDAFAEGRVGLVVSAYEAAGFRVAAAAVTTLSRDRAAAFYAEHSHKAFFDELLDYMTSGPILALAIAGEEATAGVRALNGATDPADAAPDTIRARIGKDVTHNAVHSSADRAAAAREVAFFFPERA